jgi:prephenate dehydratase
VFDAVETGRVERGVVPIENTLHGSVHANYDLLRDHAVAIVGETLVRIRHHLLGVAGSRLDLLEEVHSHPQALGQCRDYLRRHLPSVPAIPAYDTAGSAKMVAELANPKVAAIASGRAAQIYGLSSLAEGIESNQSNYTRFLALVPREGASAPGSSADTGFKTSVLYVPKENIPGVLFKSLAVFALREIDLFKIESRPLVGSPGQYIFYLDLDGSLADGAVVKALDHLGEIAGFVKVLGSYPRGDRVD